MLKSIWRSTGFNIHTKIRIFNSNVLSVLLYGSECLKTSVASERKLEVFQTKCLRRLSSRYTGQTSSRTKSCSIELGSLGYRRPSKKDAGAGLVMSSAFPKLTAQSCSSLDTPGKMKQRPAKGNQETNCPQKPNDQSNHGDSASSRCWQSQTKVPWSHRKHQKAQRGLR